MEHLMKMTRKTNLEMGVESERESVKTKQDLHVCSGT
jgi:hypothetical protein